MLKHQAARDAVLIHLEAPRVGETFERKADGAQNPLAALVVKAHRF